MPINFDPNSLNSVFDKNFGAGSFNAGLSNAANTAKLKTQANFAKQNFLKAVSAYQAKQKKDQEYMQKYGMTYDQYQAKKQQDQLNKLQDKYQVLDNGLTSDQASQMRSKAESQGRGGHQPSYDQQRKEAQQSAKNSSDLTSYDTSKMTPHNQELVQKLQAQQLAAQQAQQQQKKSSPGFLGSIGNALKGVGSEIGAAATAAEQFINPFDKVSADQAVKNYMNRNQTQGFQEFARGANRAVDSASLGLMSNLDKKLNNRTPYYNSARAFGQGGGTDMITSGLGYLVPGVGAAKGVKALGLGANSIPALESGAGLAAKLARGSQIARTVAKEGALVGGALPLAQMGINYAINPKDQNLKENLANVALGAGLGAVGDPILRGLGSAGMNTLAKFAKGDVPAFTGKASQSALDALVPKLSPKDKLLSDLNNNQQIKIPDFPLNPYKGLENITPPGFQPKQAKPDISNSPLLLSGKSLKPENVLKTVTTNKTLDQMSNEELQTVYKQLQAKKETLSTNKSSQKQIVAVEEDLNKVNDLLMKSNLQMFGKNENISPKPIKNDPTAPNPLDNHGYGLARANEPKAKTAQSPNPLDAPYKPGEALPNTLDHIGTKTVKQPTSISHTVDKLKIKTVDNLHRLSQFDKQVEKVFGRNLKPSESTHMLGLNSRGSDQISKQILTQNMVDKNGEVVGKSLKEIASSIPKGKLSQFEDYLVNKHAITRMKRGEKVFPNEMNMTTGKAAEKVKQYEAANPQFKDLAKQVYDYNKQLGQKWLVDTGILSKDQWEGYLKENPHYVPNNRIFSDLEMPKFGNNAKKGFAGQSNPVKKATGSQRKIVSPIESMIEHTAQYVKTAKRNEVMQTLINNIKQNPEAFKDWAEIVPTKQTPQSVMETLQKDGVNGVLNELNKGFDQKPDLTKGNIVSGIIDGQKVHIRVHDVHLLDAITNLQPKAQNLVISALGQVTRVMKNLTTGINPVFSLTRNIFRDIPTAYVNSKSTNNPLAFSKDLVQSIVSIMKNDSLYKSFKAVGGGHSSPISSDVNLLAQSKRAILPQKGIKPLLGKGLGALENLNNAVESAPRLAEFKRLTGNSYDSKMKALYEANDVTVNFNKYGNWAKEVDAVVPYFNAAIQGLDKQWRVLASPSASKAEKMTALVKSFVGITIPTMLLYNVNHNDPNYQKVSNYVKDTNLLIPKGDGTFYKIPKPRELGVLFGSDVERVLRSWQDGDPKAFNDFATTIMDTFAPPVRTVLAPFSDLRANKNFANAPIVPQDLQGLSPRYQYDSKTSEPAKVIGNLFNVSPKQIDYLTKSYAGVLGELGIPATTKDTTIGDTLKQKVTVDPVFSNDLQRNFYDMKTKLDQAHSDYTKQGMNNPNTNEALRKMMNSKSTQMSKVRKQMKTVQNDSSLTREERLRRVRMLQDQINQIAASVNQLAR